MKEDRSSVGRTESWRAEDKKQGWEGSGFVWEGDEKQMGIRMQEAYPSGIFAGIKLERSLIKKSTWKRLQLQWEFSCS